MAGRPRTTKKQLHPNRVAASREQAGLTQEELANRVGWDYRTLGKLERGDSRLRWDQALHLAKAMKCLPFELVPEEDGLSAVEIEALKLLGSMGEDDRQRWLGLGAVLVDQGRQQSAEQPVHKKVRAA